MARGVNKVILIGNLGKDPEARSMPSGTAVVNFSMATAESWKDKQTGEKKEHTEWHNLVAFDKRGELIAQYCKKGSQLYVEGKLKTRKWQDKEGKDRYTTEIVVEDFQFLGGKREDGRSAGGGGGDGGGSAPGGGRSAPVAEKSLEDDDIPF